MAVVRHKEAIHSGHFMISDFEAEAEDEEDIAVPPPEEGSNIPQLMAVEDDNIPEEKDNESPRIVSLPEPKIPLPPRLKQSHSGRAIVDVSLNKLFQSMSIAYRQKLTSPKWNRFRGLKLRWKDKIRLNNVIWRCWHMQFIKGSNRLLCAFANPLEIDHHSFPEGGTLLEGKYWKRKLQTITREYKKWRMFYKNRSGQDDGDITQDQWNVIFQSPFQVLEGSKDDAALETLAPEEDFFVDALFGSLEFESSSRGSTLAPINSKDPSMKMTTNSDFIQPGLAPLQPNLDDFFNGLDCQTPLNDWQLSKLLSLPDTSTQTTSATVTKPIASKVNQYINNAGDFSTDQASQAQMMPTQAGPSMIASKLKQDLHMKTAVHMDTGSLSENMNGYLNYQNAYVDQNMSLKSNVPNGGGSALLSGTSNNDLGMTDSLIHETMQQQPVSMPNSATQTHPVTLQVQNDTYPAKGFPHSAQKRLLGPATCSPEKRHSPKHRILHQREYQRDYDFMTPDPTANTTYDSSQIRGSGQINANYRTRTATNGLTGPSSPYKLPSAVASVPSQTFSYLEPRVKPHNFSGSNGPSVVSKPTHHLRSLRQCLSNSTSTDPNSELIQLLRNNKDKVNGNSILSQQQLWHQPAGGPISIKNRHVGSFTSTLIPPPPMSSAPQPKLPPLSPESGKRSGGAVCKARSPLDKSNPDSLDQRRNSHISSEQKRRGTIKNGFDLLRSLIPSLSQSSNLKISKAALLHKGGDYLKQLISEQDQLGQEISSYHKEIDQLNRELSGLQMSLATNGTSRVVSMDTPQHLDELFWAHVEECTMQNWKYYVFSLLMHPMISSFQSSVKAETFEEMSRSSIHWVDQHLALNKLRPNALKSLKQLSTETSVLTTPDQLPLEAVKSASRRPNRHESMQLDEHDVSESSSNSRLDMD